MNLRRSRNNKSPGRILDEPAKYTCSFCSSKCLLGKDSFVMAKVGYSLNDAHSDVVLCEKCSDIFCDVCRYGPRVISEINRWDLRSRVLRMSFVQESYTCFICHGVSDSHILVKFDNMLSPEEATVTRKVCARCTISFFDIMIRNKKYLKDAKVIYFIPKPFGKVASVIQ